MAYGNPFPLGYQQFYQPQQPQQPSSNLIWVQGEAGAKSYLVAPNSTVQLWDSERQTIYLKSADVSGMPSMKILDYTIRDLSPANAPVNVPGAKPEYVTREELESLYGRLEALQKELSGMKKEVDTNVESKRATTVLAV